MIKKTLVPEVVSNIGNGEVKQVVSSFYKEAEDNLRTTVRVASGLIPEGQRTGVNVKVEGPSLMISVKDSGELVQIEMTPHVLTFTMP
ncbi:MULTISPECIES: hypothetical protein [unclassified Maridesulfovibrio]|uniref:hypothetical protein n=1 Tax=unclassified Maridesulfovibrio TaxID=2794999 RepID=UPI003B424844